MFDVEGAYWTVPVHQDNWRLLEMVWRDTLYVDKVLPFGLRSVPKIYNAMANALQRMRGGRYQLLELLCLHSSPHSPFIALAA